MTRRKFHLNNMTLRKCITLKYLTKIIVIPIPYRCMFFNWNFCLLSASHELHEKNWHNSNNKWNNTRITKQVSLSSNVNLNNYLFEFTQTEASAGKWCDDLNSYKKLAGISFYWNCQPKKIKYYCGSHLQTSIYGPYWLWSMVPT